MRLAHKPKIIPVIDIKNGQAVLAVGGNRAHYRPVQSILHEGSDPIGLALAFRDRLNLSDIYVADLDAIAGSSPHLSIYRAVADLGLSLWLDSGIRSAAEVASLLEAGVKCVIAGLETVPSPDDLREIFRIAGADRLAFSLDLRDGHPLIATGHNVGYG